MKRYEVGSRSLDRSPKVAQRQQQVARRYAQQRPSVAYAEFKTEMDREANSLLKCEVDFTKPDALRTDCLVFVAAESSSSSMDSLKCKKRLYVNDFYLAMWSPLFRDLLFGAPNDEFATVTTLPNCKKEIPLSDGKTYVHMVQLLKCIYPEQMDINDENLTHVLPLAFEYQIDDLLRRCINYVMSAQMKLIDKIVLADHFQLTPLLQCCLGQLRTAAQIDFSSMSYVSLSDRTKVQILEKLQYFKEVGQATESEDEAMINFDENLLKVRPHANNFAKFTQRSEIYFCTVRSKSGRQFYCNPYYVAAWSRQAADQVTRRAGSLSDLCPVGGALTDDEMVHFLLAIHPPMLTLDRANVKETLKAACKMEAVGLIKLCAKVILSPPLPQFIVSPRGQLVQQSPSTGRDIFESLSLLDSCFLHDLFEPYLRRIQDPDLLIQETIGHAANGAGDLSHRAKAAILDRLAALMATVQKDRRVCTHFCTKCQRRAPCSQVKWVCGHCGAYHGSTSSTAAAAMTSSMQAATTAGFSNDF